MITTALAVLALLVAAAALALSILVARQSAGLSTLLTRHRLGHERRDGALDPAPHTDRRQVNLGASRAVGERRRSPGEVLPPEDSWHPEDAPTAETARVDPSTEEVRAIPRLPRPGEIGQRR